MDKNPEYEYLKTFIISLLLTVLGIVSTIWIGYKSFGIICRWILLFPIAIATAFVAVILILLFGIAPSLTGFISAILSLIALTGKNAISDKARVSLNKTSRMFLIILMPAYLSILFSYLLTYIFDKY